MLFNQKKIDALKVLADNKDHWIEGPTVRNWDLIRALRADGWIIQSRYVPARRVTQFRLTGHRDAASLTTSAPGSPPTTASHSDQVPGQLGMFFGNETGDN